MGIKTIEEDREAYRILLTSSGSDLLTQKLQQAIRRAFDLIKSDIDSISEYSLPVSYSNLDSEAYHFAEIHFGGLIEAMGKSKRNGDIKSEQ